VIGERELRERVSQIKWYHSMPLPYGIVTEGKEACVSRWPRLGLPEDVSGLALFLASDAGSYCTGGVYVVDGGWMT